MNILRQSILVASMLLLACGSVYAGSEATAVSQQQQAQGISGSGNSSVGNSGNSAVTFENSFNGSAPIRYLPVPSNISLSTRGGPAIFGSPNYADRGPHYMSMAVLVSVLNTIDIAEAEIADEGDIEIVPQMLNSLTDEEKDAIKKANNNKKPKFFLSSGQDITTEIPGFVAISVPTAKADDNNTMNSATLAVKMRKRCDEVGGTVIALISQGTVKRMSSWGVGIGTTANYAAVNSDADGQGGAGGVSVGWSWGEAEYFSLPYLTAIIGYIAKPDAVKVAE